MKDIFEQVSRELNIPKEVVKFAYNSYWKFIRETISNLPLKKNITKEEFNKLQLNINVPSLGKFYCDYNRFKYIKNNIKNESIKTKKN